MTTLSNGSFFEKFADTYQRKGTGHSHSGSTAKGYRTGTADKIRFFVTTHKKRRINPAGTLKEIVSVLTYSSETT